MLIRFGALLQKTSGYLSMLPLVLPLVGSPIPIHSLIRFAVLLSSFRLLAYVLFNYPNHHTIPSAVPICFLTSIFIPLALPSKQNIANAFPNGMDSAMSKYLFSSLAFAHSLFFFYVGLPYVPPKPLLYTSGLVWEYQASPELLETLRMGIKQHHAHYRAGQIDKIHMPLYLFLAGAGTGKSRNASEFHQTAVECLSDEDEELKNKLRNAWVFHVSLENGSSLREEETIAFRAIGNRML